LRKQHELQDKLDESSATCVRLEALNSVKCEELQSLEREIDRIHRQHDASFARLYFSVAISNTLRAPIEGQQNLKKTNVNGINKSTQSMQTPPRPVHCHL